MRVNALQEIWLRCFGILNQVKPTAEVAFSVQPRLHVANQGPRLFDVLHFALSTCRTEMKRSFIRTASSPVNAPPFGSGALELRRPCSRSCPQRNGCRANGGSTEAMPLGVLRQIRSPSCRVLFRHFDPAYDAPRAERLPSTSEPPCDSSKRPK